MRSGFVQMVFGIVVLMSPAFSWGDADTAALHSRAIYTWVADQMGVPADDILPPVCFVSREDLRKKFKANNHQSYQAWTAAYGSGRARRMMDSYLKDLVGLFNPSTGVIYVGRFLSPCRQKAILAHELTHYIQHKNRSQVDFTMVAQDPSAVNMVWEMEAYKIENRFMERVCPDQMSR